MNNDQHNKIKTNFITDLCPGNSFRRHSSHSTDRHGHFTAMEITDDDP